MIRYLTEEDGEREEVDDGLVDVRGESLASLWPL